MRPALRNKVIALTDTVLRPVTFASAQWLKLVRRVGIRDLPKTRSLFERVGVFPIIDHYYEPSFGSLHLRTPLEDVRELPGIDWRVQEQLELVRSLDYEAELSAIPTHDTGQIPPRFYYLNDGFGVLSAEFLYCMIRRTRPSKILEIGSGNSTLMMLEALRANEAENAAFKCKLTCVEPYEKPWLEDLGVELIRTPVEQLGLDVFLQLRKGDILFIDSSHVIRPQGDVLFEYLEVLPRLAPGVFVHIHDIFTPQGYPAIWIENEVRFWNEQYLVEAFLSHNADFEIVAALNLLALAHGDELAQRFPIFRLHRDRQPSSLWLLRK